MSSGTPDREGPSPLSPPRLIRVVHFGRSCAEIARLYNSLAHLQRTQEALEEALQASPADGDLKDAFDENEVVM